MKGIHFFVVGMMVFLMSCNDDSTSTTVNENFNSPVTTNVVNSFTYSVNANKYSANSRTALSFLSDSLVVTLASSGYSSGQVIISVKDSLNGTIFVDTVTSNKTIAITNLKTTKPKYCDVDVTNLTAKLAFVIVGQ